MALPCAAQISSTPEPMRPNAAGPAANVPRPAMAGVTASLPRLNQVITNARVDLAALRIDKWKTNSRNKRQVESNVESLQRNMTAALPTMVQEVRANPGSLGATFRLYRNVSALYDVMLSVTEAAGAFAPDEEYRALANDTSNLDTLRRSMADQVEAMATARDAEVAQLRVRARQAAAAEAAPAKKIVIDDTKLTNKPARKKPRTKKKSSENQQPSPPK